MDNLYAELRDIEGFKAISIWPLAPIWWVIIITTLIIITAIVVTLRRRSHYRSSWRYDTMNILSKLQYNLSKHNTYQTAIKLNETIRRIAIHKYSRKTCASLSGKVWLNWLKENDPNNYDWQSKGKILAEISYIPEDKNDISEDHVYNLIQAIKKWV
ncbi:MAG: DUF4381 domain-containing protein [Rickettsiaceae bacterium]|nr:DUF4381 domain-containing protein [Rickettsiaceae bacterium]